MNNSSDICSCYRNDGRCNGTKEIDACNCNGNEGKCDFYPEKRINNYSTSDVLQTSNKKMKDVLQKLFESSLDESEFACQKVGVHLRDEYGNFKSTPTVLTELSEAFK